MEKNQYELTLNEIVFINDNLNILRVPGGWLYNQRLLNGAITTVFVPFDSEFDKNKPPMTLRPGA